MGAGEATTPGREFSTSSRGLPDGARSSLPIVAGAGARGEDQRLYHHRHRTRSGQHGADVDVIEILQLKAIDGNDRIIDLHLLRKVNAHEAADVSVAGEHEWMPARQNV